MVGNMDFNNPNDEDPVVEDEGVGADAAVDEDEEMHDSGNEDEDADFEGTYCDHISIILFCFLF